MSQWRVQAGWYACIVLYCYVDLPPLQSYTIKVRGLINTAVILQLHYDIKCMEADGHSEFIACNEAIQ